MALNKPEGNVDRSAVQEAEAEAGASQVEAAAQNSPEVKTEQPATTSGTGVAVADSREVTTQQGKAVAQQATALRELEDDGFAGLEYDYTSFPAVTLKDGEFNISNGGIIPPEGFIGTISMTRKKFAVRIKTANDDDDADVQFTFNRDDVSNPATVVGAKVKEWEEQNLRWEVKDYVDCFVMIDEIVAEKAEDKVKDLVGEVVVCQIPHTSIGRLSGMLGTAKLRDGLKPNEFQTHFLRGTKVTSSKFPFYPWDFKKVKKA